MERKASSYFETSLISQTSSSIFPSSRSLDVPLTHRIDRKLVADIRALSQTCRWLRELTLPLVWPRVEVETVKQLGELHELLKFNPSIAPLIKTFRLLWKMDGDCSERHLNKYPREAGLALDLAFRDRLALWNDLMKEDEDLVRYRNDGEAAIYYGDYKCLPPGRGHDWDAVRDEGPFAYDWLSKGPDGNGEDRLIKNAMQFRKCIIKVVNRLTPLETFGWETEVSPMQPEVFAALEKLTKLSDLRLLVFSTYKHCYSTCEC